MTGARRVTLPIWLRARNATRLGVVSIGIGFVSAIFVKSSLPLPVSLTVNQPTVPFVVYAPAGAVILIAWQMSLQYEPNETLSCRPLELIRASLLLTASILISAPLLFTWWIDHSPWALVGARNFLLAIWGTVIAQTVLGLRLGTTVVTLLILFVPSLTRTDARGNSSWWALTEAPTTSLPTVGIAIFVSVVGLIIVLSGADHHQRPWLALE